MNRWLFCFAVMTVGCVASLPPSDTSITADLACETSRAVVQLRQGIRPTPAPASDDCENCEDGWLGDGRIKVKCPICGGTGKKPKPAAKPAPCTIGNCPLP